MIPGLALILGLLIGAGIVYVLMQSKLQQKSTALQQTRERLNQLDQSQTQLLQSALEQKEADFEERLATKIETYQDDYARQIDDLEAEYEARLSALIGLETAGDSTEPQEPIAPIPTNTPAPAMSVAPSALPDPWDDSATTTQPSATPLPTKPDQPLSSTPSSSRATPETSAQLQQTATELGQQIATNRRETKRFLPTLGRLSKNADPAVRLAAVEALKQVESSQAIPFLRQALRDPDNDIVAAASAALNRFKGTQKSTAKKPKKKLPKNR